MVNKHLRKRKIDAMKKQINNRMSWGVSRAERRALVESLGYERAWHGGRKEGWVRVDEGWEDGAMWCVCGFVVGLGLVLLTWGVLV